MFLLYVKIDHFVHHGDLVIRPCCDYRLPRTGQHYQLIQVYIKRMFFSKSPRLKQLVPSCLTLQLQFKLQFLQKKKKENHLSDAESCQSCQATGLSLSTFRLEGHCEGD